jgi:hypothetical protein
MYKLVNKISEEHTPFIQRLSDNAFIPFDPMNIDYQEYLKWVAEGNEPAPPDEPESP